MMRIGLAVADDPAAAPTDYAGLHGAHAARILRLCRLLVGDPDDAQELCQEVFLRLHRALRDGPPAERWDAWLTTVALNACRDHRRSGWWRWLRRRDVVDDLVLADPRPGPEAAAISRQTRERLWRAVRALPARQREVFALRQLQGYSTDETATLLGLDAGTVKQHLFRAIRALRAALGDDR